MATCQLRRSGEEALRSRLAALPNLFHQNFVLMESCAGIGGARRACDLLGVRPALYMVNEVCPSAIAVLRHAWPAVEVLGTIEEL